MSRIAFYAPIKPPDHPIASGDRLIAQNLMKALEQAGYDVQLASRFIAYSKREDYEILQQRKSNAWAEAQIILEEMRKDPPDLWLTYHPYCKAPDWIGPIVSSALSIPYVTVEAAKTGQGFENGQDRWAHWREEAQAGIKQADLHLAFKPTDRAFLTELLGDAGRIKMIPPFIETQSPDDIPTAQLPTHWRPNTPTLLAVGMMRPGKKLENYRILAEALAPLEGLHWNLILIGGGPEEGTVRDHFSRFDPARLLFTGAVSQTEVLGYMKAADLFVWPGFKEPIGMVYLEAQSMGLPVAALNSMGVPLSVVHGETGLLADSGNETALCEVLRTLISHPSLRTDFAANTRGHIEKNHSMASASTALTAALSGFITP